VAVSVAVEVADGSRVAVGGMSEPGMVGDANKAVWAARAAAVCTMAVPSCSGGIATGAGVVPQANIKTAVITRSVNLSLLLFI
jgi:hypothetical protein